MSCIISICPVSHARSCTGANYTATDGTVQEERARALLPRGGGRPPPAGERGTECEPLKWGRKNILFAVKGKAQFLSHHCINRRIWLNPKCLLQISVFQGSGVCRVSTIPFFKEKKRGAVLSKRNMSVLATKTTIPLPKCKLHLRSRKVRFPFCSEWETLRLKAFLCKGIHGTLKQRARPISGSGFRVCGSDCGNGVGEVAIGSFHSQNALQK